MNEILKSKIPLFFLILLTSACTQRCSKNHEDMNSEEVLEAYLELALNIDSIEQKSELMEFTSGALESTLAGVSDETFTEAYINRKFKFLSFSIVERRDRTPRETEITFLLTYLDFLEGSTNKDEASEVSSENTVVIAKEKGKWFIQDVLGNNTSFDFPVSELSEINASAP